MGWDLGLSSPTGFNSKNAYEQEDGFSLYIEDILEQQPNGLEEFSQLILNKLLETSYRD